MAFKKLPEQDRLKQLLNYDPATGVLTWRYRDAESFVGYGSPGKPPAAKAKTWNTMWAGNPALADTSTYQGYARGGIDRKAYFAHRIIWKWWWGTDPVMIDHINGDRLDNRISNLRETTYSENARNVSLHPRNTSGHPGVKASSSGKRWRASISVDAKLIHLGTYDTFEQAREARRKAERNHGFGVTHGRAQI